MYWLLMWPSSGTCVFQSMDTSRYTRHDNIHVTVLECPLTVVLPCDCAWVSSDSDSRIAMCFLPCHNFILSALNSTVTMWLYLNGFKLYVNSNKIVKFF